jgi:hypothetical protein
LRYVLRTFFFLTKFLRGFICMTKVLRAIKVTAPTEEEEEEEEKVLNITVTKLN